VVETSDAAPATLCHPRVLSLRQSVAWKADIESLALYFTEGPEDRGLAPALQSSRDMSEHNTRAPENDSAVPLWLRTFRRWFIEYNPLYLCSAMLVLGGVIAISQEVARAHLTYGHFVVAAIAELYAWALIGGAALLTRIGLRRPAVMLALLAALYQCDVTLHAETSVYLGAAGVVSIVVWLGLFVTKLYAFAWAVHLRLSRSAIATASLGALGVAVIPRFFHTLDAQGLGLLVTAWLFSVFALALWTSRGVRSSVSLSKWGQCVLRRASRATWAMWSVLALFHVALWYSEYDVSLAGLVPAALLLSTRWMRREVSLWSVVVATLVIVGVAMPELMSLTCVMVAAVFALRALRQPTRAAQNAPVQMPTSPYRSPASEPEPEPAVWSIPVSTFALASETTRSRSFTGAITALYLSTWTLGWSGGPWPEHLLVLDLLLSCVGVLMIWKARSRLMIAALTASSIHFVVQSELIPAPETTLQWGALSVCIGFALLIASVAVSWWYGRTGATTSIRAPEPR